MDLISTSERDSYTNAIEDMHDTFARDIILVKQIKTPQAGVADEDDDYDFTQNHNTGLEEFVITESQSTVKARVKYIDKQDQEFALVNTLGGEQLNLVQKFGIVRIKVRVGDSEAVQEATSIIVDGNNCNILFRDRPHGVLDIRFHTFFLQRTP